MSEPQSTKLNRRWLIKMSLFALVGAIFGVLGLWDGLVKYPARGQRVAQFELLEYFEKANAEGRLFRASVDDPAGDYEALIAARDSGALGDLDAAKLSWLVELRKVNNLTALSEENTEMAQRPPAEQVDTMTRFLVPATTRDKLQTELQGKKQPSPLSSYDLLSQHIIAAVGWIVALLVGWRIFKSMRTVYRYDAEAHRLTLPDGREITPAQIDLVDKREWHKFFVYFKLKESGDEVKLDLLRFAPLEQWVLDMAKHVEGYEPSPEELAASESQAESLPSASE